MKTTKFILYALSLCFLFQALTAWEVSRDDRAITIDGKRRVLLSGSIHYPRSTQDMWPDLLRKSKEGGLNTIETYVFWNAHEPSRRQYDFNGNLDLVRFIKSIKDEGLYAVLRIGPYVCAEWNYGGFPVWLHNMPGVEFRTANSVFMNEMQNFTTLIVDMMRKEKLFASQGGPIILAQIENEYGNVMSNYGDAGKAYVDWCANLADSYQIGIPWLMCQQTDAPPPMYHGGTNFGRTSGGPYFTTSYDYDAPLDEYGNLNQPKWGHLKELHKVLIKMEKTLTHGNISNVDYGNSVIVTIYATEEGSGCFFGNANTTTDATITFQGSEYVVPAWSVSILPDCKNEEYNTAKVNTQTSLMVKKSNEAEEEPASLKWVWRPEIIDGPVLEGKGKFAASKLIDQKQINDESDYLWYMTSVNLNDDDPIWSDNMTLHVNGSGHVLHAYVNGEYLDSEWATYGIFNYKFEKQVKLKPGPNQIALLSATVGLQNYGPMFDLIQSGIPGPVEIVGRKGDERVVKDLSAHKWSYKVGLRGLDDKLFNSDSDNLTNWLSEELPNNKRMTWYKTTFKAPLGSDSVVLDLLGMGKGFAWVNGHNIGRYWPSYMAQEDGCITGSCDYRGSYDNNKCLTGCGEPSQRYYHVPRSFMDKDVNTLVLLEEFGGNPSHVSFKTVTMGTACGNAFEKKTLELSCQGKPIAGVLFASFGDPQGSCGSFTKGTCDAEEDVLPIIQKECVGKDSCSVEVIEEKLGKTTCGNIIKRLVVEAVC
ncbi:hypothetical protein LWI28_020101 [Acer negundo]|uniref:Beta-galactosidase n=1 Tax=Acer negundo TaxID=4023 RepID=A0AAD5P010_ACENE|nr:hypothetical protein LWI28_020101 [Acer negundo]